MVGGDVIYGHCFQLLAEDKTPELRAAWIQSLNAAAALEPKVVEPSHMQPQDGNAASHIAETKRYIEAWPELLAESKTWEELEGKVKAKFPQRVGSFILRWSAQVPFGADF